MTEQIAVVIKAARRAANGDEYLKQTVENLMRSVGLLSPILRTVLVSWTEGPVTGPSVVIPEAKFVTGPIPLLTSEINRLTLHQNAARSIHLAAEAGAEWAMVIEDDIDFCADFLGSVLRWVHDVERTGEVFPMYVLGANYAQIEAARMQGHIFWHYPPKAFYGNQALMWRTSVAKKLVEWLGPDPNYNGVRDHGHDLLLGKWGLLQSPACFCASAPSFVQHIGETSGIGNKSFHFPTWPGREWKYESRVG